MFLRNQTRIVKIKNLEFNDKILIQSMLTTKTSKKEENVIKINELEASGCEIIRVSILDLEDINALPYIISHSNIPIVCDIHYNYKFAILAIQNGCHKIRINPGNIGTIEQVKEVVLVAKEYKVPIRIGINSGSLPNFVGKGSKGMIEACKYYISIFESLGFYDIVVSLKGTDIDETLEACLLFSNIYNYPQHIGITEAGPIPEGIVKSTVGLGRILQEGIGNTIRVSLTDDPINEVLTAKAILKYNNLLQKPYVEVVSCPTCGRTIFDIKNIIKEIQLFCSTINKNIKVSILACVVNGIGEGKDAQIGIACSSNYSILFKDGREIKKIDNKDIIEVLKKEIINY